MRLSNISAQNETLSTVSQVFKPNKVNLSIASALFVASIELTGGWEILISNVIEPSTEGFSVGFPFDAAHKVAGSCPSIGPSSEPVECLTTPVRFDIVGLISNIAIIYGLTSIGLEIKERCLKWL